VHAGHGLDYKTTKILTKIIDIEEYNIGHFIIGESIFDGLSKVIKKLLERHPLRQQIHDNYKGEDV